MFAGEVISQAVTRHFRGPVESGICFGIPRHHLKRNGRVVTILRSNIAYRSDALEQLVIFFVEGQGEGAVDDPAVDMSAKINLADVVVVEHRVVSIVWRVVGSTVVDGASRGESWAGI